MMYKIYFPLFDHHESRSNEVRLTHEGLLAHPQVTLVDRPELADYLIFCQNHLVDHCPFHTQFRPIKDRYKERTILLDYGDDPNTVFDAADFRWKLYFKRSCVDRSSGKAMHYGGLRVIPTAYAVVDDIADPPPDYENRRRLDIACLFDHYVTEAEPFKRVGADCSSSRGSSRPLTATRCRSDRSPRLVPPGDRRFIRRTSGACMTAGSSFTPTLTGGKATPEPGRRWRQAHSSSSTGCMRRSRIP